MILLKTTFWRVCTKISIRDSEQTGQRVDGHPGKQLPLESHGRESLGTKKVLKGNVEDRHDRTAKWRNQKW